MVESHLSQMKGQPMVESRLSQMKGQQIVESHPSRMSNPPFPLNTSTTFTPEFKMIYVFVHKKKTPGKEKEARNYT